MDSMITLEIVKNIIERRNEEIHKGDCGRILIAAGSEGMAGAAVLCGRGAMRAGAGLVQILAPKELFPVLQVGLVEATCLERDLSKIDLGRFDAAAIGPGLGGSKESIQLVRDMIESFDGPLVADADGLNIIAAENLFPELWSRKARGSDTVITPHMGEAQRLLGEEKYKSFLAKGRKAVAIALAEKTGAITILKGSATIVATEEGKTYTNTTGNPGMATGGSGDVLTGIVTALMGQKLRDGKLRSPIDGAIAGVFIHGLAGDLGARELGQYGLMAGDIAHYTALAIKRVLEES